MLAFLAALALQPATPPPAPPPLRPPATDAERAADRAVRAATGTFLAAKQEGRYDEAWAMLAPEQQARRPREGWAEAARDFVRQAGAFRGRRITGVSFHENPGGVPGSFVAVEYSADYANLAFLCGIVIWKRQPDASWLIFRESVTAALLADVPNPTPEAIAEGRRYAQCRD